MPRGRPPTKVTLDDERRAELWRRSRAATSTQREARRARIILACEHFGADAVAARVGVHVSTVERWRLRFIRSGLIGLEDKPRPGHRPKIGPVERLELIALACEPVVLPQDKSRTIDELVAKAGEEGKTSYSVEELAAESAKRHKTTRTIEELVEDAVRRGLVSSISWSTYQRLLADIDLKPHKVEQWVHSPDPEFKEKVTTICDLYLHRPEGSVVLCIDEKTGMQAIERRFPDRPPAPGRRQRREFEYKRHGTQSLLCAFEVQTGRAIGHCGATRTAADLVRFMEQIAVAYPNVVVHVIWDCLNIHFDGNDGRWTAFNQRHNHRFVFHYTPKHASWVNQVECFFSIVQRRCLANSSFPSTEALRDAVLAFIDSWNRDKAHPFRWTFSGYPLQTGIPFDKAA